MGIETMDKAVRLFGGALRLVGGAVRLVGGVVSKLYCLSIYKGLVGSLQLVIHYKFGRKVIV